MKKALILGILGLLALTSGCTFGQDPTASVYVTVQDDSGNAIEGANIKAYTNYQLGTGANDKWTNVDGTISSTDRTDAKGNGDVQIAPLLIYAITASKDGYKTNGIEKQIITGSNYITITLTKEAPRTATLKVEISDSTNPNALLDLGEKEVRVTGRVCPLDNGPCSGTASTTYFSNPIGPTSASPGMYDLTFALDGYEEYNISFSIQPGEDRTVQIQLRKKVKSGTFKISLKDKATGKLIDVSTSNVQITGFLVCPTESWVAEELRKQGWSAEAGCLTAPASSLPSKVSENPIGSGGAGTPFFIGDVNLTFGGDYAGSIVIRITEGQLTDATALLTKKTLVPKSNAAPSRPSPIEAARSAARIS